MGQGNRTINRPWMRKKEKEELQKKAEKTGTSVRKRGGGQGNRTLSRNLGGKKVKQTALEKKIEKLKEPGKTYTPAQLLYLKRKAQGKTTSQAVADNKEAVRQKQIAKHKKWLADRAAKKTLKAKKKENKDSGLSKSQKNKKKKYPSLTNLK